MPRRARSHQLEDQSRNRFRELVPGHWVVRDRTHDYGIDFEVEVFTLAGDATGLIFWAQLKATDHRGSAGHVRMKTDQLNYLANLGLPVALFRYCSADDSWRWCWIPEIDRGETRDDNASLTVRFRPDQAWNAEASLAMVATLETLRGVRTLSPRGQLALVCAPGTISKRRQFEIESAIGQIVQEVSCLATESGGTSGLVLRVHADSDTGTVALDRLALATFPAGATETLAAELLYAVIGILRRVGLPNQAHIAARSALRIDVRTKNPMAAIMAMAALLSDAQAAAELAIANGLHKQQDPVFLVAYHQLLTTPVKHDAWQSAVDRFTSAALAQARAFGDPTAEAAMHYNMANTCLSLHQGLAALLHLNRARKLRPTYVKVDYFLVALGSVLFLDQRYRLASKLYRAALEIAPDDEVSLFLADTLMFSGRIAEAQALYGALVGRLDHRTSEVALKEALCAQLHSEIGADSVPIRTAAASAILAELAQDQALEHRLLRTAWLQDRFHPLANFNLGILHAASDEHDLALWHFLACAFRRSGDTEAWINALAMAIKHKDAHVGAAVIECAIRMGGPSVREMFRQRMIDQDLTDEAIEAWDNAFAMAQEHIQPKKPVLYRILDRDAPEPTLTMTFD